MQPWTAVRTGDGSWTLRHPIHDQACHSLAGAWQEAVERYALPCRLRELGQARVGGVVRLLDVGTGAALNLAAARRALVGTGARLEALTLEVDAAVLASAAGLPASPPDPGPGLAELRAALAEAARAGGGRVQLHASEGAAAAGLELALGDARTTLPAAGRAASFDAVFLDPFSPSVEPELWDEVFLRQVAGVMAPWAILSTYSASVRVRRALAGAGLLLGRGPRVGTKASGTLASPAFRLPPLPLREARKAVPRGVAEP